ncbi:MAG: Uncharacterized protein G01um10147_1013 [Microgenomates group bacterium Gr01-1014_7]|nr:MAG: Uncharacterized protein G01um10147_1013 [Microgenomates group bacterium Gr01-1014_7]
MADAHGSGPCPRKGVEVQLLSPALDNFLIFRYSENMKKNTKVVTHTISIIRNRGQLTIPDSIRALRDWAVPNSAITITSVRPDEIVIRPHKKEYNFDKMWELVRRSRAIKGKGHGSAAEFIAKDRLSH